MTNHSNSWKTENVIIKILKNIIIDWSNYFSPAPKQGNIRLTIDWYVFKRMKRYIFKKYGSSYLKNYLKLNQNKDGSRKKLIGFTNESYSHKYNLFIPRLYDMNTPVIWTKLVPKNELLNSSFLYNPTSYIKRTVRNTFFKKIFTE